MRKIVNLRNNAPRVWYTTRCRITAWHTGLFFAFLNITSFFLKCYSLTKANKSEWMQNLDGWFTKRTGPSITCKRPLPRSTVFRQGWPGGSRDNVCQISNWIMREKQRGIGTSQDNHDLFMIYLILFRLYENVWVINLW